MYSQNSVFEKYYVFLDFLGVLSGVFGKLFQSGSPVQALVYRNSI